MNSLIFSNNLRALRKTYRVSQEKMALDLCIDRRTIGRIERDEQNPSLEVAYRLAAYFKKTIPEVFPLSSDIPLPTFNDFQEPEPTNGGSDELSEHNG